MILLTVPKSIYRASINCKKAYLSYVSFRESKNSGLAEPRIKPDVCRNCDLDVNGRLVGAEVLRVREEAGPLASVLRLHVPKFDLALVLPPLEDHPLVAGANILLEKIVTLALRDLGQLAFITQQCDHTDYEWPPSQGVGM